MPPLFSDIQFALRVLSKNRSFTAVVVLALAAGIGANTAIFSMADAIVFHPYPFKDISRLAALWESIPTVSSERYGVASGDYFDWKERNRALEQMAAYQPWNVTLTSRDGPQRVHAYLVSADFFPLLSLSPIEGRALSGVRNEVVVSYGFWQQRLGRDPHVLGRILALNGLSYTVVGVMGREFDFPMYAELWSPWIPTPEAKSDRVKHELQVIARLRPSVSLAQARAEMKDIGLRLAREYPSSNFGRGVGVMLLRDTVDEYAGRFMAVVTGAVVFLLLLACANVANLQLARGASRRNEMALRMALGASRTRIVGQLLVEGIVLSSLGAGLGFPLAIWCVSIIKASMPEMIARHVPGLTYGHLDSRMLFFTFAAALLTGIAFTAPAAAQACSERLHETLKEGGRGTIVPGRRRMRSVLVVSEIIFAVALLIGAGFMLKGFRNLATMKPGFDPSNVLTFGVALPESKYRESRDVVNFYREMLRQLNGEPEMRSVALISELPALADSRSSSIFVDGQSAASPDRPLSAEVRVTSEDYFRTLAIPIQMGRSFRDLDGAGARPVAVISKSAARRFWPGQDALGRRVKLTSRELTTPWLTVVGVVGDVNHFLLDSELRPTIYIPYTQQSIRSLNVVMGTTAQLNRAAIDVRAAMRSLDPTQPLPDIEKLSRFIGDLAGGVGVIASLMGIFAGMALVLATSGIYAVTSYSVAQRTREIGIRMALGARPQDVLRLIVGNALRLVGIGLGAGLLLALALSRGMSSVLPGVIALDPLSFAGFALLLAAIAMLASFIPSRRATKVDPLLALRSE